MRGFERSRRNRKPGPYLYRAGVALGVLVGLGAGAAQAAPEEIVVTAQKREQTLQTVPMAVSAVSGSALKDLGAVNFEDFARTLPSLDFSNLGAGQNRITIRGISTFSGVSVVGIYLDDSPVASPVNFTQPSLALYDLNRIELLRGPQGTLYGEGSLGGTLRYITNDANTHEFVLKGEATLSGTKHGSANYDLNGVINVPLAQDRAAVRLVAGHREDSGFIDNVARGNDGFNQSRTDLLRGKATADVTDALTAKLSILYQNIRQGGPNVESFDTPRGELLNRDEAPESYRDRILQYSGTLSYDLGWASLQSTTAYFDRSTGQVAVNRGQFAQGRARYPGKALIDNSYEVLTEEARIVSSNTGPLKWLGGVFYKRSELNALERDFLIDPAGTPDGSLPRDQHFEQVALFGEAEYAITDKLFATVGLRWFDETDEEHDVVGNLYKVHSSDVIPRFVLRYQFNPDQMVYVSVSKGFRSAGVNQFPIPGVDTTYKPDTTWNYEIGTKVALFDRQVTANVAVYLTDWNDLQTFVARPDLGAAVFFVQNSAAGQVKGVEWELQWSPAQLAGLSLGTNGNYTDARYTADAPFEGKKGNHLPKVPNWKASAFAEYRFPVLATLHGRVRADYEYTGAFPELGDNKVKSGNYALVNLRAGLEGDKWSADLFIDNLFDKRADLFQRSSVEWGVYRNRPLTVGVTTRWQL